MEQILQVGATLKSGDGRTLDRRSVHPGIRVGETEFDDINAAVREDLARTNRVLDRREANGQVRDESSVAALEGGIDGDC